MPRIEFSHVLDYAKEPSSAALQAKLEEFFNKPDVQEKMTALAKEIFPSAERPLDSPFSHGAKSMMIPFHDYLPTADSDGNPFNLCAAVLYALRETSDSKSTGRFSLSASEGLKKVAGDMLTIVQQTPGENELKTSILKQAESAVTVTTGRH